MEKKRIGQREIKALEQGESVWDSAIPGFHARRQRSDAISYVVFYRTAENRQRFQKIGRHGAPWTPDQAREEAKRVLGLVASGADPASDKRTKRHAATMDELCTSYLNDLEAGRILTRRRTFKADSTIVTDRSRINAHIRPLLGSMKVASVSREDIETFMHAVTEGKSASRAKTKNTHGFSNVRGGKGAATRTVGLLGAVFQYAVVRRMRPDNPVRGVIRPADGKRDRRLSDKEYAALGAVLDGRQDLDIWPYALKVAQFMILTGWRSGAALNLRWENIVIDRHTAVPTTKTKTGSSVLALSQAACDCLGMPGLPHEGQISKS